MYNFFINKKAQPWLGFFVILFLIGCGRNSILISFSGFTMGTTYSIRIIDENAHVSNSDLIKIKVDSVLTAINQQMSTYISNSEISIFNERSDTEWQNISKELYTVIAQSIKISQLTNGAFDITVGPLVKLWGFGTSSQAEWKPPDTSELANTNKHIGFNKIELKDQSIRKFDPYVYIDLNAIAKGFGVDCVFEFLQKSGYQNILVEIGGEIRASGENQRNQLWKVGIDKPIYDVLPGSDLQELISLNNCALATSGDYRNYFEYNSKIYSHTISPITGFPVENSIASASVIAPNCMLADALATALMVMGEDGLFLIEQLDNVEALLVKRISKSEFKAMKSSGWNLN